MSTIKRTTDLSKFQPDPNNRQVRSIKRVSKTMVKHGWIETIPATVKEVNGKLIIKDGQHRHQCLTAINEKRKSDGLPPLPMFYVIESEDSKVTASEISNAATPWNSHDYLGCFAGLGNSDYIELKGFCQKTGIAISCAVTLMEGNHGGTQSRNQNKFKDGKLKIKSLEHGYRVGDLVTSIKPFVPWSNNSNFVNALSRCCRVEKFKDSIFIERCKSSPQMLKKQASLDGYMDLIDMVYNYRSRAPIPLKFLAEDEMRKRSRSYIKDAKAKD